MPTAHQWFVGRRRVAALACVSFTLYALLAVAYTFPLATRLDSSFLHGIDYTDAYQLTWVLGWVQHALSTQANPYNAPIYFPNTGTLGYIDSLMPVAVLTLPVRMVTNNPLVVYNIAVLLSFPCSAIAMYALAMYHAHDHRAAFLAGIVFAFAPYRSRHLEHLNMLNAECIPLILLSFEAVRQKGGRLPWLALGVSLLLGALTSVYYLMFTGVALCTYAAALALRRERILALGSLRGVGACLVLLPIVALALAPYAAIQAVSTGPRRLQDMAFFSADLRDYLHAAPESVLYGWTDSLWHLGSLDGRQFLFPGFIALVLAVIACVQGGNRGNQRSDAAPGVAAARAHVVVAAVAAVFTLGPYLRLFGMFTQIPMPYMALYFLAPPLRGLRDVGRYEQVGLAFLGVSIALGAARVFACMSRSTAFVLFVALSIGISAECWIVQRPLVPVASARSIPAAYQWLAHQPQGLVLELPLCDARLPGSICTEEFIYMYYQTYHWHPLVNGWAGSYPKDWGTRVATLHSFPSPAALAYVRSLHVRYVIVHSRFDGMAHLSQWIAKEHTLRMPVLVRSDTIGGDIVLQLNTRG